MPAGIPNRQQRPYVVAHVAVSVDGATTGFVPDGAQFYRLIGTWHEDATLAGAETILAQEPALTLAPRPGPAGDGPLLAVVDGRGRVRQWEALRDVGHWRDVLALHSAATPPRPPGRGVAELVAGENRVDLAAVLAFLARHHGVQVVRVESGGALIEALLAAGLLDEASLLIHPCLVGVHGLRLWRGAVPAALTLASSETLDGGLVWLRYRL
jgi:2,5-diamino-6-(ribosylamino)-4(3H)-pyrimidinone 5'-phosphate reductase